MTATGRVTHAGLVTGTVTLTVQLKRGAAWRKMKSAAPAIVFTGTYSWHYKPAKTGAYRMRATIARTAVHAAATTKWVKFRVK